MKIFSQSPSRISLCGGSSDIPEYYNRYNGLTLSFAINIRQKCLQWEGDDLFDPKCPQYSEFPSDANPEFYYTILREFNIESRLHHTRLQCTYDATIKGGLGSSASAAVALVAGINKRLKLGLNRQEIAEKAWDIEVNKIGLFGGKQDHYAAAFGGVNVIEYSKQKIKVTQMPKSFIEPLLPYLVLLQTGIIRPSDKIQENLKELTDGQIEAITMIKGYALAAIDLIGKKKILEFGDLMDGIWQQKKRSNKWMSNIELDTLYDKAIKNGALGGKLLGSGGGGHFLFIVPPEKREGFVKKMGLQEVDFDLAMDGAESRIL